jgi:transglutaminase-like putative cysteine protease/predicted glutamine amidotransferase
MHSELLGISTDAAATPRIEFHLRPRHGAPPASWGLAWYPSDDPNSSFMKDTHFHGDICVNDTLPRKERLTTSILITHTRVETKRVMRCDAQPFRRPYGRTDCVFAHSGDLDLYPESSSVLADDQWISPVFPAAFEPVGSTDSERMFCRVLHRLSEGGGSSLGSLGWDALHGWLLEANRHGTMSLVFSNGQDLIGYRDLNAARPLWQTRWTPPRDDQTLRCGNHDVSLDAGEDGSRTLFAFASRPDPLQGWAEVPPGGMIVVRNADVIWAAEPPAARASQPSRPREIAGMQSAQPPNGAAESALPPAVHQLIEQHTTAGVAVPRVLRVVHETRYAYTSPVEASHHVIRLHPTHDHWQEVLEHTLDITPAGDQLEFEDVFGNQAVRLERGEPYTEFIVRMTATVRIDWPNLLNMPHQRRSLPLTWMPWQRQMMHAYLLPPELPETQLRELSGYANSFVERRDYDLVETLVDINTSINRDFAYVSGSTTTETTPFEVYSTRAGVCQDFANLFICMARLLGIPARYRVGYIYTGSNYENTIQSDASHAWAEAYLPHVGWRGFDPTNGCLAGPDHIRVAVGRNFRDATPTAGTIFKGGMAETLTTRVEVHDVTGE